MKYLNFLNAFVLLFAAAVSGCKKTPEIVLTVPPGPLPAFSKTFGGERDDYFCFITKTPDGGYIAVGGARSGNGSGDIPAMPVVGGNYDMLIVKLAPDGNRQWVTTIGGDQDDYARSIVVSPDGSGYMVAGHTASNNSGDIPVTHGGMEMVVVKLGIDGKKQWVKTFGGNGNDEAHSIAISADGHDYVIAGSSTSNNSGDIPTIHQKLFSFFSEVIVFKMQVNGNVLWIKNYGGNMAEDVRDIVAGPDGYALSGYTSSDNNGDIPATHDHSSGSADMMVIKLGIDGNKQWVKTFGGNNFDFATSITPATDGNGFLVAGMTVSDNSGDIPASHGDFDVVVVKLDAAGNKQWLQTYGGAEEEDAFSIAPIPGEGYIVAGFTASNNSGDISQSHATTNSMDLLAVRLRPDGSRQWVKTFGGDKDDHGLSVTTNSDGSILIAGSTASSNSFDVSSNHGIAGTTDGWILKLKN
jgi:hypothetical protein